MIQEEFVIDESIVGYYSYHIRYKTKNYHGFFRSLCGVVLLGKSLSLKMWGTNNNLQEKYCKQCHLKFLALQGDATKT